MMPGPEFTKKGSEPSVIPSLADRLRGSVRDLLFCLAAGFLLVAPGLALPMFTQVFVDRILVEGRDDWLRPLIIGMIFMGALQVSLRLLQLKYLRELRMKLAIKLSGSFLWHVLRLPISFFAQRFAGEISSRVSLNDGIAHTLSGQLATTVIDCMMLVFYTVVMIQYDAVLTVIGVLFAFGNVLALRWVARKRIDANMRLRQEMGKVAGVTIAGLQSIETLKASAQENSFFSRWAGYYTKGVTAQQELGMSNQNLSLLPGLLASFTTMLILVVGGIRVMEGHLTIGMLIAFQSLMFSFQGPVTTLIGLGSALQTLQGDLKRVDDVLLHPTIGDTGNSSGPPEEEEPEEEIRLNGHVELKNVTFGYNPVTPPLIENFNLTVKPGQRVALVGGSGSGKSTLAKLVSGLFEPWSGEILFDGKPRERIDRRVMANSLAMVDQDILFFAGSVRDNLTLWDETVPRRHLDLACRDAEIQEIVRSLPGGCDGSLLEGAANLSGGQRQRLEIARALVNNPTILVLDEATSALDTETEFNIDRHLRKRGCSTIVVAHRLSTIRDCEEIIVLRQGKVIQRGTHEALWDEEGEYRRLIESEGEALKSG